MDDNQNFNYHIIPIKTKTPWLMDHRVFYFQLGKRPKYEGFVKKNYEVINRIANQNGLSFIFHRHFTENNIDHSQIDHEFFKEISNIDEKKFYDELELHRPEHAGSSPLLVVKTERILHVSSISQTPLYHTSAS